MCLEPVERSLITSTELPTFVVSTLSMSSTCSSSTTSIPSSMPMNSGQALAVGKPSSELELQVGNRPILTLWSGAIPATKKMDREVRLRQTVSYSRQSRSLRVGLDRAVPGNRVAAVHA